MGVLWLSDILSAGIGTKERKRESRRQDMSALERVEKVTGQKVILVLLRD
jgi:hypothetical protein